MPPVQPPRIRHRPLITYIEALAGRKLTGHEMEVVVLLADAEQEQSPEMLYITIDLDQEQQQELARIMSTGD